MRLLKFLNKNKDFKNYFQFSISQNIKMDIEMNCAGLQDEALRDICLACSHSSTVIYVTESNMKIPSIIAIKRILKLWRKGIKTNSVIHGNEGHAYRFLGLVRGDEHLASTALGIAWLVKVRPHAIDTMGDMMSQVETVGIAHPLNFFVYSDYTRPLALCERILWVEPQTGEIVELNGSIPKLMIL